ncbi:MAG TPA: cytosol nonspecific dipeptidase [Bacteroidales bacterium]|nr:cytosol nonspecific dipeptidase [Bacteroidales bacterium]
MTKALGSLQPASLWSIFEDFCNIPHISKHEARIVEYVCKYAQNLGLEYFVDQAGNVVIRKEATPGMGNRMGIILQGHLDMVAQKNNDTVHDFLQQPIRPFVDGDWVKAHGTTLGADNGIGAAAALAALAEPNLQHGPLEILLTIEEETGLTGAKKLQPGMLKGDILINLDSEDEGELYIGCAGGIDTVAQFTFQQEPMPMGHISYQVEVKGLKGGHSGLDIHLGRGNAIKSLNRLLWELSRSMNLRIASFNGGSLRNAIPREAAAVVAIPKEFADAFESRVAKFESIIKNELGAVEPNFILRAMRVENPTFVIDNTSASNLLNAVYACPNGAMRMVSEMPEVVETSTNLAIVKCENGSIEVSSLQRSSVDSAKDDLANMLRAVFEMANAQVVQSGSYPGWKPNLKSPILKAMKEVYRNKFGKTPEQKVIHAGLECGIISGVYPNLDLISFGPTIKNPHSPDEMVNIPSVELFYDFLLETLQQAPVKY